MSDQPAGATHFHSARASEQSAASDTHSAASEPVVGAELQGGVATPRVDAAHGPPPPQTRDALLAGIPDPQLLLQASQVAQQVFDSARQLEQREQDCRDREAALEGRERQLQARQEAAERRERELQQRDQESTRHKAELDALEQELESRRRSLREEVYGQLAQDRQQLDADRAELVREREETEQTIQRAMAELAEQRAAQREQLEEEAAAHATRLNERREKFEQETARDREQVEREANVLRNRYRFQLEHLQTTRRDLEEDLRSFRRECQQHEVQAEQRESLLLLRMRQLDHYRLLLEERELSVEREQQMLVRSRDAETEAVNAGRQELEQGREQWRQQRAAEHAEITRQQQVLSNQSRQLEQRQQQLDRLRQELEQTHRENLELRMAVDECGIELANGDDREQLRERIESTRRKIADRYLAERNELVQVQRELQEQTEQLERERTAFRGDREQLAVWLTERDQQLKERERELERTGEEFQQQSQAWREARTGWLRERTEAEHIIRGLLQQLSEFQQLAAAGGSLPAAEVIPDASPADGAAVPADSPDPPPADR